jgi:heat shock protein HtpX
MPAAPHSALEDWIMETARIPGRTPGLTGQIKTVLLLGALTAFVVGAGSALAPSYAWLFVAVGVLMNLGSWFFSDRLILRSSGARLLAREEAPELHQMVAELASAAGIPAPRLFVTDEAHANAFATGRNPAHGAVAVTSGLLRTLPRTSRTRSRTSGTAT